MLPCDLKIRTQKQKNDPNWLGKIKVKVLIVFSLASFGLVFAQLVFANSLAADGKKLSDTNRQIEELEAQNTRLMAQIAENSSLTNLAKVAQGAGFIRPSKIITPK